MAKDGSLLFLDVLVRKEDRLMTSVYREKLHTNRYIHFTYNHHDMVMYGVIGCLRSRAARISELEDLEAEEEHLRLTFKKNCYPGGVIKSTVKGKMMQEGTEQAE